MPLWGSRIQLEIANIQVKKLADVDDDIARRCIGLEAVSDYEHVPDVHKLFEHMMYSKMTSKTAVPDPYIWIVEFGVVSKQRYA
jgi:hypothetical protein